MDSLGFNSNNIEEDEFFKTNYKIPNDSCKHYQNSRYDLDVFYGCDRVIFVIRTKYGDKLSKYFENKVQWIIPNKTKKFLQRFLRKK